MRFLAFCVLLLLLCKPALADVIQFGAATRCGSEGFEIAAVVQHNKEFSIVTDDMKGIHALPEGTHNLKCRFGKFAAKITVRVFGGSNGMCMGAGYVDIGDLFVSFERLPVKGPFNWACKENGDMLVKLRVYPAGKELRLERCVAKDWEWEYGYVGFECKYIPFKNSVSK